MVGDDTSHAFLTAAGTSVWIAGGWNLPVAAFPEAARSPALTNVVKHAEATSARVTATTVDGGPLRLEVSDDGRGGADASRGSGLVGLADRVAAGGGTMAITSPAGAGTTISVTLPLQGTG
jgi:glucose-6-phosphate-specific signal transduction histidine kinase